MENTSYGINVANRYDLFAIDDEGDDPFQMIASSKQKAPKKQPAQTSADSSAAKSVKNAEKENKVQSKSSVNNENRHPESGKAVSGASANQQQRGEKHGIKETQKDNIRTTREEGNKNGYGKNATSDRRNINKTSFAGENREEKNNRKNREVNNDENAQRRSGQAGGGNKRFESRGKREFDRQSGSNKTGVKAVEKRDGTGSHNWGSAKADAKEYNNFQEDYSAQETEDDKGHSSDQAAKDEQSANANEQSDTKLPIEEELKEMTLDEWKAQTAANRAKPQYNIRKAGEGEDAKQWDKMVALDKKKSETEGTEEENETQKIGKQKQVLDIEFHFNDGRRGGLMGRSRGRGGKGGARNTGKREGGGGGGAGGVGGGAGGEKKETNEPREGGGETGEKRDRRNRPPLSNDSTFGSYKFAKQSSRFKNAAPKVDDEHDFPSLG